MKDKHLFIKSIILLISYFLGIYSISALPLAFFINTGVAKDATAAVIASHWCFIIAHVIVAVMGLILFRTSLKQNLKAVKQHIVKWLVTIILGLLIIIAIDMLCSALPSANQTNVETLMQSMAPLQHTCFIIIATIIAPINEEVIFRKILIGTFSTYLPRSLMIICSGLLFGLMHIPSLTVWPQAIPYALTGIAFGCIYIYSKENLWYVVGIHWINNLISIFL